MCFLGSKTDRTYGIASSGFGVLSDTYSSFRPVQPDSRKRRRLMRGKIFIKEGKTEERTVFTHKLGQDRCRRSKTTLSRSDLISFPVSPGFSKGRERCEDKSLPHGDIRLLKELCQTNDFISHPSYAVKLNKYNLMKFCDCRTVETAKETFKI